MPEIKLYGANRCHKTQYYKRYLKGLNVNYSFLDVELNNAFAEELLALYTNRKLNFPTLGIGQKRLKKTSDTELKKGINKL
ncbi:glutaredoxin family protein [Algibacter pectinivorans]|uniref:Glutaredoxin domain-containing protein n=1 Tax=Algibacter pectinivorans TaxID=870482 RepID=A0A1I1MGG6_9FLAO|nr:glutaredoxin domain-containing protein [Algibacter pectinivorans]SFC84591.1 hypothetical protein SAMN04487987_101256 [Algibacter pectinivorans]